MWVLMLIKNSYNPFGTETELQPLYKMCMHFTSFHEIVVPQKLELELIVAFENNPRIA